MKKEYLVVDVLHSGRKGKRNTQVDDYKYRGLIGYKVGFDINELEQGKGFMMWVLDSPHYREWYTTMIVAAWVNEQDNTVTIETANSLYILKEILNVKL